MITVYGFIYCSCIHEGGYSINSLHRTKMGVYKAMKTHLIKEYYDWYNHRIKYGKNLFSLDKFGEHELWVIKEFKILD